MVGHDDEKDNAGGRGLDLFSPQGLGNLAWSYAKQAQLAETVSESLIGSSGRLAVYETSCLDVGETLINRLFQRLAERATQNRGKYSIYSHSSPTLISNKDFCRNCFLTYSAIFTFRTLLSTKDVLKKFKPQDLSNTCWAFATLGMLHKDFFEGVSKEVQERYAKCDVYYNL